MRVVSAANSVERFGELDGRQRLFTSLIRQHGQLSRREIQQLTGVHPTLTGDCVATLIDMGLLREAAVPPASGRGRPQIPLELDPDQCVFIGVAISPGSVRVVRVDPTGRARTAERVQSVHRAGDVISVARGLLDETFDKKVFAVGVSVTGIADIVARKIILSSSAPSESALSLQPIFAGAHGRPLVLNNDMHALATRWAMTNDFPMQHVLLVGLDDGRLGASILIDGQPLQGALISANELGHTRFPVDTDKCFCGQRGCLERIVSTAMLKRAGAQTQRSLDAVLAEPGRDRAALKTILNYLTTGLSNAVNLIRPETLVLSSPLARHHLLRETIESELPAKILPGLRQRVKIIFSENFNEQSAENAAWLALAPVVGKRTPAASASL